MVARIRCDVTVVEVYHGEVMLSTSGIDTPPVISQNDGPMKVPLALLADAANVSEGKLNILGSFSVINARKFPTRHPEMKLVIRVEASPAEVGMEKKIEVAMLDEDGKRLMGVSADFTVPEPQNPGETVQIQTILGLRDTVFPKAGRYAIHVLINGNEEATVPLTLVLLED